jgi:hypothetical protein
MLATHCCRFCRGEVIFRTVRGGIVIPIHVGMTTCETARFEGQPEVCHRTRCPKCGGEVFFVRHNGGAVWFDELGKPWDKHGCFDLPVPPLDLDVESFEIVRVRDIKGLREGTGVVVYVGRDRKRSLEYEVAAVSEIPRLVGRWCYLNRGLKQLRTVDGRVLSITRHAHLTPWGLRYK